MPASNHWTLSKATSSSALNHNSGREQIGSGLASTYEGMRYCKTGEYREYRDTNPISGKRGPKPRACEGGDGTRN